MRFYDPECELIGEKKLKYHYFYFFEANGMKFCISGSLTGEVAS